MELERSDIIILLDRSGSMEERRADHEGGLRSFVRDSQALAGDVRLTFVRFDSADPCEVVFEAQPVGKVNLDDLTLIPRGGTPLLDAVGQTLSRFAHLPGPVIAMIITDGQENQSKEWTKEKVKALVEEREKVRGWKLLYLGANVDEFSEAGAIGVAAGTTLGYAATAGSIGVAYRVMASNTAQAYDAHAGGQSWQAAHQSLNFTEEQRTDTKKDEKETE